MLESEKQKLLLKLSITWYAKYTLIIKHVKYKLNNNNYHNIYQVFLFSWLFSRRLKWNIILNA